MYGGIKIFKRSLIGGFNRRDVMSYIKTLGEERNRYREEKERVETEAKRLDEELLELRSALEEAESRIRRARADVFDEASDLLSELEMACESVKSGIESTTFQIRSDLVKVGDSVTFMSNILKKTNDRLSQMRIGSTETLIESLPPCGDSEE